MACISRYATVILSGETELALGTIRVKSQLVKNVTPQMLHNTWVEVEYRLNISRDTNGNHVDVYGT